SDRIRLLNGRVADVGKRIHKESSRYWRTFEALSDILRLQGHLNGNVPTPLGRMAAGVRCTNELFMSEVAVSCCLYELSASELAAVFTCLVTEEGRASEAARVRVGPQVDMVLDEVHNIARRISRLQRDFDVEIPVEFSPVLAGVTQMWAEGADWE